MCNFTRGVSRKDDKMESPPTNNVKETGKINDYYKTVVEPLLAGGSEEKLCEWLKKNGLITKQMRCNNEECKQEPMKWSKARVIDRYNWICVKCKKKVPIRNETFLADLKCDFSSIFSAIDGWCSHKLLTDFSENKTYKIAVGKRIYTMCTSAAETFIKTHAEYSILGGKTSDGEDAVVLVDVFPDGSMTIQSHNNNNNYIKKVLCVADVSYIPARIWAQLLDNSNEVDFKQIVETVVQHVKPNTTIVTSNFLYPCIKNAGVFTEVINMKTLIIDPAEYQRSLKNIETIWATTVETCLQLQPMNPPAAEQLLYELQWRQAFGTDAFRYILQHLVQYFNNQHNISSK